MTMAETTEDAATYFGRLHAEHNDLMDKWLGDRGVVSERVAMKTTIATLTASLDRALADRDAMRAERDAARREALEEAAKVVERVHPLAEGEVIPEALDMLVSMILAGKARQIRAIPSEKES